MEMDLAQQRQHAHDLLDLLPAAQLRAVQCLLTVMISPEDTLTHSLSLAPLETEALTPETVASLNSARMSLSRGEGIAHDEILREFDLAK
jgi:hypothetical protein